MAQSRDTPEITMLTLKKNESDAIQALRFVAALLVYFQHVVVFALDIHNADVPWFWLIHAGGTGVCIFFVISGFIMSMKLNDDPREFLTKRLLRIYPSFWIFACISLALQFAIIGKWTSPRLTSLALLPSDVDDSSLRIPFWTLTYEVVFYLICAVLCVARPLQKALPYLLLAWFGAIVGWEILIGEVSHPIPTASQILFSRMNLYFIAGMFFGLYKNKLSISSAGCVTMIVVTHLNILYKTSEIQVHALLAATCGFTILLLMKLDYTGRPWRFMANGGNYSYGLYLAHLPLVFVATQVMKGGAWQFGTALTTLVLVTLPAATILAVGEYHFHKWISAFALRALRMGAHAGPANSSK